MHYSQDSDFELLSRLVGKRDAERLQRETLLTLFTSPRSGKESPAREKLAAARELVQRLLAEELKRTPVLDSPQSVRDYLRLLFVGREYESFVVLFLDAQHHLIAVEEIFRGTLSQTSVYPREIVKRALEHNCGAIVVAHNHPSGVAEPSRADELLTQTLKSALGLVEVRVLDHIVVAGTEATSLAERGLL